MAAECGDLASHRQGLKSKSRWSEGKSIQGGNTLHGECGPSWKASPAPGYGAVGVYRGGSFHRLMSGRSIPAILQKGWGFPGTGSAPTFWPLWSALELSRRLWVCHLAAMLQRDLKTYIYFRSELRYAGYSSQHIGLVASLHVEKEMATHCSILAWKIPWTEEAGGQGPWGRKESDTTEVT